MLDRAGRVAQPDLEAAELGVEAVAVFAAQRAISVSTAMVELVRNERRRLQLLRRRE